MGAPLVVPRARDHAALALPGRAPVGFDQRRRLGQRHALQKVGSACTGAR
jgi:hypothetical protein